MIARLLCVATLLSFAFGCAAPEPVRVVSFNIRYANEADGENAWRVRKDLAIDTLRALDPDVAGLQEVLASQFNDLRDAFQAYDFVGVGRDDGAAAGEFVPIMFRRSRFTLVERGHVWLSESPEIPGSVGWDAACPRMVTWVRLRFRENPLVDLVVFNTHWDHRGREARIASARLVRRMVESIGGLPIIVTGDFNCAPYSEPYAILLESQGSGAALHDTYLEAGLAESAEGTFNGFEGRSDGARIDWVLSNRRWEVLSAGIDRTQRDGRFPSDHFPVHALLQLRGNEKTVRE